MGDGAIALGDSLALLPWHLRVTSTPRTAIVLVFLNTLARGKGQESSRDFMKNMALVAYLVVSRGNTWGRQ